MRYLVILSFFLLSMGLVDQDKDGHYRRVKNTNFGKGEHLKYYAHYGFIRAAEGEVFTDEDIVEMNGRPCYKMSVYAKTTTFFDVIAKVRNEYGTYIDTTSILPQKFYRYVDEGSYKRNEIMDYDHENDSLFVHTLDLKTRELVRTDPYAVPDNIQDMVSGMYYLRTMDFSNLSSGDTLSIDGFFKNKLYDFKIIFDKKEVIKTKLGKIRAIKIRPIMPNSPIFDGKDSVEIWLSDDANKVPLKVKSALFVGAIELDIKLATGLKHPLNKV